MAEEFEIGNYMDEAMENEMQIARNNRRYKEMQARQRKGAPVLHRNQKDELTKVVSATLQPHVIEYIKEIGKGNFSAGIRELVRQYRSLTGADLA